MIAILIHFLGGLVIDSAVPPYVAEADAGFLAAWYLTFAAVDLLAVSFATTRFTRGALIVSFAWSMALVVEQILLQDHMQRYDWVAQWMIDGTLFIAVVLMAAEWRKEQPAKFEG
ncbi:hypothetical protein AH02_68 [Pseudomonas phage AH02]|nr:hypothetical protein AH02_68 [Pseudomonas phage AH02]